jgi:hypothetical protein
MRRCRALATQLGLSDAERWELAMMVPGQAAASGPVRWSHLSTEDLAVLCQYLRGAELFVGLVVQRADALQPHHPGG